jgi:rhodanese-related sulfurtransferase
MNSPAEPATDALTVDSPMEALLAAWPGARRALFARYHIGGCSSCGFQPGESLAEVCARHDVDPAEALAHLREAAAADASLLISPIEAKSLLDGENPPALIDLRTREEHDAVALPGSLFFTEDLQREAFATWEKDRAILLYDHTGNRSLDMAAWFAGHGLRATRALTGGIDAWSREVDRSVPRYRIEMED